MLITDYLLKHPDGATEKELKKNCGVDYSKKVLRKLYLAGDIYNKKDKWVLTLP